jgi:hypothetical protein
VPATTAGRDRHVDGSAFARREGDAAPSSPGTVQPGGTAGTWTRRVRLRPAAAPAPAPPAPEPEPAARAPPAPDPPAPPDPAAAAPPPAEALPFVLPPVELRAVLSVARGTLRLGPSRRLAVPLVCPGGGACASGSA